jgi:hypothetical protein
MAIEFAAVWLVFWVITVIRAGQNHDKNCIETWKRWYLQAIVFAAGPEARKRLARVRARNTLAVRKPAIVNNDSNCTVCRIKITNALLAVERGKGSVICKPCDKRIFPEKQRNGLMVLPGEGVTYTPIRQKPQSSHLLHVKYGTQQLGCRGCSDDAEREFEKRVERYLRDMPMSEWVSRGGIRGVAASSKDHIPYRTGIFQKCECRNCTGAGDPTDACGELSRVNAADYFHPSPDMAEAMNGKPDDILTEVEMRARRDEVWYDMKELVRRMEMSDSSPERTKYQNLYRVKEEVLRKMDVVLDKMSMRG